MKDKVSVVIPVFNGGTTLARCLEGVLRQGHPAYEVIVVDNGSTDNTRDIAFGFREKDPRVRYVTEAVRSRGAARNAGIREAKGDIIAMTDADCLVPADWLTRLVRPIVEEDEDMTMGWEEDLVGNFWSNNIQQGNENHFWRNYDGRYIAVLDTKNFAVKSRLMKTWFFDEDMGNLEDIELSLRLRDVCRIRFLPAVKVGHHHKASLMSWLRLNFNRGYWARKIYQKHRHRDFIHDDPMFQSMRLGNFLIFPFWLAFQVIKNPSSRWWFIFISELGWRTGQTVGRFHRRKPPVAEERFA